MSTFKISENFSSGASIKDFRVKIGMNQSDFWRKVGTTQSAGSRYETGRNIPKAISMLLVVAYGTEKQAQQAVEWLRNRK